MSTEIERDSWAYFSHNGQRWTFDADQLALWDDEEEDYHFHSYHGLAEPNVESLIKLIDEK
jgi:hypothetical protein